MVWRRIKENIDQLGVVNALLYQLSRVLNKVSGGHVRLIKYNIVAQPVPAVTSNNLRPSTSSPVRLVTAADPVVVHFPRPQTVIFSRFESGAMCFVAEVRSKFAGYLWLAFRGYDEDEVRCRYELASPEISIWDYDVYVDPEFRMGRTFARLWEAANMELASRNIDWSYSRISAFNPGSVAAHRRLGIRNLFTATFVCFGSMQLALLGVSPFVHLSWSSASKPLLRLKVPAAW